MTDVLKLLPPFSWRGVQYPVTSRDVDFAHKKAKHPLQYRNGELVEMTGRQNLVFRYTIPMREDIAAGPYKSLFTGGLQTLFRDALDRTEADLLDPVYGPFVCTVNTYADSSDVNKRDGTDITIEFEHSPELDEDNTGTFADMGSLQTDAGALNEELGLPLNWNQEPPPEALLDPLSAIAGAFAQVQRQGDKISASLDDLAFRAEKVETAVDRAENPQNWPLKRSARRVRETAHRLKARAQEDPTRKVIAVTQRFQTTVMACATENGLSLDEFLRLNKPLAVLPFVPAGTIVRKFG